MRLSRNGIRRILVEKLVDLGQSNSITYLQVVDDEHLSRRLQCVVRINLVLYPNLFTVQHHWL